MLAEIQADEPMPASSEGRGRTTGGGGQLAIEWEIPPATPAASDFVCWLWAAFPSRDGRLPIARIAEVFGVSPRTVRRWIAKDAPHLNPGQIRRLHQRAILRGRGHYLWPDLDPATRRRSELLRADALRNHQLITTEPDQIAHTWRENGTLSPHVVQVVHYPRAHVYGVSAATHDKAQARLRRSGEIIETTTVPNKFAAIALKQEILARVDEHRCIAPKQLVPSGRTETWRELGGLATLRQPLQVAIVRFAGLPADRHFVDQVQAKHPGISLLDHQVSSTDQACQALTQPADLVILASRGWTRRTWGKVSQPWPGGRWYVGGRGPHTAGMSLEDLVDGVAAAGGLHTPTLIVAVDHAIAGRAQLRQLLAGSTTQVLIPAHARRGPAHVDELLELIAAADRHRDDPRQATASLTRYVPA